MELTAVQEKQYQKEIDRVFKSLMRQLRNLSRQDKRMVTKAFEFAREAHKDTRRKSGEPYILHPLAVATIIVKEMGLKDAVATACALIHDVVEDTDIELSDIKRQFGPKIMEITNGLTKIASSEVKSEFVSLQAETFRKILLTISDDVRVILIKLADRLHNMRTLGAMRQEKVLKIASETMYIYAPLAHRLGLYEIKTELEDLSFKYSDSKQYNEIAEKVQASKEEAQLYIQRFIEDVRKALRSTGLKYTVKSRYKSIYSVYQKMERKRLPFEEIYDLYAIRIILEAREGKEREDCWQVYSVLSGLYRANPKRLRDWITHPKENGYESLHTTLRGPEGQWIELQIRTTRMDEVAEKGIAAHWIYKGDNEEEAFLSEWIAQIREVLANPSLNALEAVREFKENLQPNDVIVFTPKGEMIRLPVHATVLDFAFKIHTDLGSAAIGARVNQKVEVLDHELRSGDTVEVLTSRKAKPTKEWLRYVRTPRAKDYIKHALKMQRKEVVEQGKALFNWRAAKYGVDENHPVMRELLVYFVIPNEEEFFYLLGSHKIETQKIQEFIRLKEEGKEFDTQEMDQWKDRQQIFQSRLEDLGVDPETLVLGKKGDIDHYVLGKCCRPVQGDEILGFVHADKVVIHRTSCPKAISLMSSFGSQIIKAKWAEGQSDVEFLVAIKIVGVDKQGMLNELIKVISMRMKRNIRRLTIDSHKGLFEGVFHVFVQNTDELKSLLKKLEDLPNVYRANRFDVEEENEE